MESELMKLVEGNNEANRYQWAKKWKERGGKVIGLLCSYIPEEVIYAAGMLPWRVTGSWNQNVSLALAYRKTNSCPYCTHVLESVLSGELDFLDGVIASSRDQDLVRLLDVWKSLNKTPLPFYMFLPHESSMLACQQFGKEIRKLMGALEDFGGNRIGNGLLKKSIFVHNKTRNLLTQVYRLRRKEEPSLSGAETLGITTSAMVMPKEDFNRRLEGLMPYLQDRKAPVKKFRPRLLVSGDLLDNPAYLRIIEELGCVIAMDDLDSGSRYFWKEVELDLSDPVQALARRYLQRPAGPHMFDWESQAGQVIQWVRDFNIDGVIELVLIYSQPRQIRVPFFRGKLNQAGIPNISLTRDYHLSSVGQLSTRVQAFLEMLER